MKTALKEFCSTLNIKYVGIAPTGPYDDLTEIWKKRIAEGKITGFEEKDFEKRIDSRHTLKDAKSIIVCLFPYYMEDDKETNLSNSTFSIDYHFIVKEKLLQIADYLSHHINNFQYKAFVDNGPLVERYLAYGAGLGYFGMNSHIINDEYGSYVFIGYIINNYLFDIDEPLKRTCIKCGACIKSCPGNAIKGDFDINPLLCRSYLTQKKEKLSKREEEIIKKHPLVYGCDICQQVCPHNKDIKITNMDEFKENSKKSIDYQELLEISNKEFKRRYGDRAFSWRGKKLLERNFELIMNEESKEEKNRSKD